MQTDSRMLTEFRRPPILILQNDKIMTLLWIAPWTIALLRSHHIQYIEMEASFKAVKPCCFIVPPGVMGNSGRPLGLTVILAENAQ
jgi:hypothetical protein